MVIGIFNENVTCAQACWSAEQDKCVCSCGGVNHGIMRPSPDEVIARQPERTKRVRQHRYRLVTVTQGKSDANKFCKQRGQAYVKSTVDRYATTPPNFLVSRATPNQIEKWPELAGMQYNERGWFSPHIVWALAGFDVPTPTRCAVCGNMDAPDRFKTVNHRTIGKHTDALRNNPDLRDHHITHADYTCPSYWPKYWVEGRRP